MHIVNDFHPSAFWNVSRDSGVVLLSFDARATGAREVSSRHRRDASSTHQSLREHGGRV